MKKTILLFMTFLGAFSAFAEHVDENRAKQVGQSFLLSRLSPDKTRKAVQLRLAQTGNAIAGKLRSSNRPAFYVFNDNSGGFVIVSGDDRVAPVLGYSNENSFDPANIPPNAAGWLESYREQIEYIVENNISPSPEVRQQWDELLSSAAKTASADYIVAPLIQTRWNQVQPYNNLCPTKNGQPTPTGCVATAMAQIMNYHRHPAVGSGQSPAYTTRSGINIPSVDFSATTYDWANMTNIYSNSSTETEETAVATLMYHCGVSVEMEYDIGSSEASSNDFVSALTSFFGYSSAIQLLSRCTVPIIIGSTSDIDIDRYDDDTWHSILRDQLDKNLPVYYDGRNNLAGHAFICDGYSADNYFHFNWGWGGAFDGNYLTSALTGGYNPSGFNLYQSIVIDIKPDTGERPDIPALCNNPVASGITGSVAWVLCPDGTLTVCGQGGMPDYNLANKAPWYNYRSSIKSVIIEEGVTKVGSYAFYDDEDTASDYKNLTSLTLPQTLRYIGSSAFAKTGISGMITIPNAVLYIAYRAFSEVKNVSAFEVGSANLAYASENEVLFNKKKTNLIQYPMAKTGMNYNIPSTVTAIGDNAFYGNRNLESVNIPASVSKIGENFFYSSFLCSVVLPASITEIKDFAFAYSYSLTSVTSLNPVPFDLSQLPNVFNMDRSKATLTVPAGSMELYKSAPVWKNFGTIIEKAVSSDATLSNLAVNAGMLAPQFSPDITDYTVSVKNPTDSIAITATQNHAAAFVSGSGLYSLNVGENPFNISVMAENGARKTYTVKVIREAPTGVPSIAAETKVYLSGGWLHVNSPVAEMVQVYSVTGVLLYSKQKAAGGIDFPIDKIKNSVLIVKGSSGWVRKVVK